MASSAADMVTGRKPATASLAELDTFKSVVSNPDVQALKAVFDKYSYPLRFAGGPVRDLILGKVPSDLDFATTATPDQMKEMFTREEVRLINAQGEKHGTITARINDRENFEVTTLRIDKVTDGRRAEVEFTEDWGLDANRRDLTVNSMFLDLEGTLYDYFGGREDLAKRRVAFVGEARERIQEDYLRILRYFRFYGRISMQADAHEDDTIAAIKENVAGLYIVSGERIWMELAKILKGNYAGELLTKIVECGLSKHCGLPDEPDTDELKAVWKRVSASGLPRPHPVTLLTSLFRTADDVMKMNARLKVSAFERDLALFIVANREDQAPHPVRVRPYQYMLIDASGYVYCTYIIWTRALSRIKCTPPSARTYLKLIFVFCTTAFAMS